MAEKAGAPQAEGAKRSEHQLSSASRSTKTVSVVDPTEVTVSHVLDINVKSDTNASEKECGLSWSAVVSPNRLLLADKNNNKVKLLDTHTHTLISELQLQSEPWDAAVLTTTQAAITMPDSQSIILLDVADTLKQQREITVKGKCSGIAYSQDRRRWCGIAYSQDRLVVTFIDSSRIEIIDLKGNVITRIENASDGSKLFEKPQFVCVSRDGETIYVSDFKRHTVTRVTFGGVVKSLYHARRLSGPRKLCTDNDGNVYVCGYYSENVHMMTANCRMVKVVMTAEGLYSGCWSVSYCRETKKLFITMLGYNKIKVFQLS